MPCYDERDHISVEEVSRSYQDKLDKYARMMCSTLLKLSSAQINSLSFETQAWWRQHQEFDRRRGGK